MTDSNKERPMTGMEAECVDKTGDNCECGKAVGDEGAGAVLALEWVSYGSGVFWGNGLFSYEVWERARGSWWWRRAGNATWYQPENDTSLAAVKAAAQADYERRILSALAPNGRWVTAERLREWANDFQLILYGTKSNRAIAEEHIAAMRRIAGGENER